MGLHHKIFFLVVSVFLCNLLTAQNKIISGFVRDSLNGEKLVNAYVLSPDQKFGTTTNNEGYFTIKLPENQTQLLFSYIGYKSKILSFRYITDSLITVELTPNIALQDIIINADGPENSRFRNFAITEIPVERIKFSPAMLGEVDLFKTIQQLPGVTNTWAGFSGMVVRGGNSDQNLVLLDDIPLYTSSHFYGLFSVINENSLQSVRFMKGAIPARYGGRLSSVVDVTLKEGNKRKIESEFGIGIMTSSFLINGPLKNKKTTFSISARRSMSDLLSVPYSFITDKTRLGSYFGDLSGKITHAFSTKDLISISYFGSIDKFYDISRIDYTIDSLSGELITDEGFKWGTNVISLKYNHIFSPILSVSNSVFYSSFFHERHTRNTIKEESKITRSDVTFLSQIKDVGIRSDWLWFVNNSHRFYFGFNHNLHLFKPGVSYFFDNNIVTGDTTTRSIGNKPINISETTGYLEYDFRLLKFLSLNIGLRSTLLDVSDTLLFLLEPRVSGTIFLNPEINITFFYTRTNQYFHFLRSSILDLPTDLWIPASSVLPSEQSEQLGIESDYKINTQYEISLAVYYKEMGNLVHYKEGTSILPTSDEWSEKIDLGNGTGYGAELFINKKQGKLNGYLSYTLAWSKRQFPNINNGKEFYSSFDRRHEFSIATNYQISQRIRIGLNWLYSSGIPYSMPSFYMKPFIPGTTNFYVYEEKNNFRLPSYHRLDIGFHHIKPLKKHPERQRTWSVSIYNAYNRKNPYFRGFMYGMGFEANLFLFLPSVSYKINF